MARGRVRGFRGLFVPLQLGQLCALFRQLGELPKALGVLLQARGQLPNSRFGIDDRPSLRLDHIPGEGLRGGRGEVSP